MADIRIDFLLINNAITQEDINKAANLEMQAASVLLNARDKLNTDNLGILKDILDDYATLRQQANDIINIASRKYAKSRTPASSEPSAIENMRRVILKDCKALLNDAVCSKTRFESFTASRRRSWERSGITERETGQALTDTFKELLKAWGLNNDFMSYRSYLEGLLELPRHILFGPPYFNEAPLYKLIDEQAAAAYEPTAEDLEIIELEKKHGYHRLHKPAEKAGLSKEQQELELNAFNAQAAEQYSLFNTAYKALYNGPLTNNLHSLAKRDFEQALLNRSALSGSSLTVRNKAGTCELKIENYTGGSVALSPSQRKILDAATAILSEINNYRAKNEPIKNVVEINLTEYGKALGRDIEEHPVKEYADIEREKRRASEVRKELRKQINKDLTSLSNTLITFTEIKGRNKGDYNNMRIISNHSIRQGFIRINFDTDAAEYLCKSYVMQMPTSLFKTDNRNPNAYPIGRYIALHNSMDNNRARGTANTLSVLSLLGAAPEIKTIEELKEQGRNDWRKQINSILEKSLDSLVEEPVCYLGKWEYYDKVAGKAISREDANKLPYELYSKLYVDFTVIDYPDQTERQERKAEKKAEIIKKSQAKAKKSTPKS